MFVQKRCASGQLPLFHKWNKSIPRPLCSEWQATEPSMTTLEAIAFGAMLAWTPSLIILAASLWDVPEIEEAE
jgi:hypothetical protein